MHRQEEEYRGFIISWVEPPLDGTGFVMNLGSNTPGLHHLLDRNETVQRPTTDLEAAKAEARRIIDAALARSGRG